MVIPLPGSPARDSLLDCTSAVVVSSIFDRAGTSGWLPGRGRGNLDPSGAVPPPATSVPRAPVSSPGGLLMPFVTFHPVRRSVRPAGTTAPGLLVVSAAVLLGLAALLRPSPGSAVNERPARPPSEIGATASNGHAGGGGAAEAKREPGPLDDLGRGTPRSSMRGFLEAAREGNFERAAEYLDLRRLRPTARATGGPALARDLYAVLDRTLWVELDELAADPAGAGEDGLPADRDRVGTIRSREGPVGIDLQRVRRADGERIWKVSAATVEAVPGLYEEFGYGELGEILPPFFFELRVLEIQLWQWIGLAMVAIVSALIAWLGTLVIVRLASPILSRSGGAVDPPMVRRILTPFRLGAFVLLFSASRRGLALAQPVDARLDAIETGLLIVTVTWVLLRAIDAVGERISGRLAIRGQIGVVPLVRPARRAVKLLVVTFAGIVALDTFGFNVTALVAGLGVGGIAVALAAQKSLENLFGAITLFSDQPVRVGDFCRFGDRVGTVEEIGLRSTRVRTLDRTLVAIPNAAFSGMELENFSARDRIWYHPKIGLRYETTPEQIRYVLVEVRRMLCSHPRVDPDPARIRFVGFGAFSLDFEVFAYVRTQDFGEFLEIAEDLNLRLMDIVAAAGSGFACPSQTTYVESGGGIDRERGRAAEARVRAWRERGELDLPGFPREEIDRLGGSLDDPPAGSPEERRAGDGAPRS